MIYNPADDDRLEDVNMALPVEITLSVDDTGDVPDDLTTTCLISLSKRPSLWGTM